MKMKQLTFLTLIITIFGANLHPAATKTLTILNVTEKTLKIKIEAGAQKATFVLQPAAKICTPNSNGTGGQDATYNPETADKKNIGTFIYTADNITKLQIWDNANTNVQLNSNGIRLKDIQNTLILGATGAQKKIIISLTGDTAATCLDEYAKVTIKNATNKKLKIIVLSDTNKQITTLAPAQQVCELTTTTNAGQDIKYAAGGKGIKSFTYKRSVGITDLTIADNDIDPNTPLLRNIDLTKIADTLILGNVDNKIISLQGDQKESCIPVVS